MVDKRVAFHFALQFSNGGDPVRDSRLFERYRRAERPHLASNILDGLRRPAQTRTNVVRQMPQFHESIIVGHGRVSDATHSRDLVRRPRTIPRIEEVHRPPLQHTRRRVRRCIGRRLCKASAGKQRKCEGQKSAREVLHAAS